MARDDGRGRTRSRLTRTYPTIPQLAAARRAQGIVYLTHQELDPHCTCPDCILDHAARLDAGTQAIDPFLSQQPDAARAELSPADRQRRHLDTFQAPGLTPAQAAGFWRPQLSEMHRRAILVSLEQQIAAYTLPIVLEALADALTLAAATHEAGDATGPYAALAATIEHAREYAIAHNL